MSDIFVHIYTSIVVSLCWQVGVPCVSGPCHYAGEALGFSP